MCLELNSKDINTKLYKGSLTPEDLVDLDKDLKANTRNSRVMKDVLLFLSTTPSSIRNTDFSPEHSMVCTIGKTSVYKNGRNETEALIFFAYTTAQILNDFSFFIKPAAI